MQLRLYTFTCPAFAKLALNTKRVREEPIPNNARRHCSRFAVLGELYFSDHENEIETSRESQESRAGRNFKLNIPVADPGSLDDILT